MLREVFVGEQTDLMPRDTEKRADIYGFTASCCPLFDLSMWTARWCTWNKKKLLFWRNCLRGGKEQVETDKQLPLQEKKGKRVVIQPRGVHSFAPVALTLLDALLHAKKLQNITFSTSRLGKKHRACCCHQCFNKLVILWNSRGFFFFLFFSFFYTLPKKKKKKKLHFFFCIYFSFSRPVLLFFFARQKKKKKKKSQHSSLIVHYPLLLSGGLLCKLLCLSLISGNF